MPISEEDQFRCIPLAEMFKVKYQNSMKNTKYKTKHNPSINICIRKRPIKDDIMDIFTVLNETTCALHRIKKDSFGGQVYLDTSVFYFDHVFDVNCNNQEIYSKSLSDLVQNAIDGHHSLCFAYGETGSGKTHTMYYKGSKGLKVDTNISFQDGLCYRASIDMACRAKKANLVTWCRIYELYMSKNKRGIALIMYDLLNDRAEIFLLEDFNGTDFLKGVSEFRYETDEQLASLLKKAIEYRQSASTQANLLSSRSHMVLELILRYDPNKIHGKLCMIDLAGSEQYRDDFNTKARIEMTSINRSLMHLNECINNMSSSCFRRRTSFRGCTLTRLQRDSYNRPGTKVCMIATVYPGYKHEQSLVNTIMYAKRLSTVRLDWVTNQMKPTRVHVVKPLNNVHPEKDKYSKPLEKRLPLNYDIQADVIGEPFLSKLYQLAEQATRVEKRFLENDECWKKLRLIEYKQSKKLNAILNRVFTICNTNGDIKLTKKEIRLTRLINMGVDVINQTALKFKRTMRGMQRSL